ncbi:MAG: extracellular solute-binding protein [Anaerolineales bacterium]|nr:extracellular solute-binding protein [Anaerolineales bacterium]
MKNLIQVLLLSVLLMLTSSAALAQEEVTCQSDAIVQRDDWLSKLADKFWDDPTAYPIIAEATNAKNALDPSYARIDDVNFIDVGWKLCIPGSPTQIGSTEDTPAPIVLKVWDIWSAAGESQVIETLNREFEADHPGVEIRRTAKTIVNMQATARPALGNPDGPDIVQVNPGRSDMAALVAAGLLADLTPYWREYGWADRFPAPLAARNRVLADGSAYGRGNLYGLAPTAELVGVFYNKNKFAAADIAVPTSLAEFEDVMAALKATGETPLMLGNLDGWPALHLYGEIQNAYINDPTYLADLIYGRGQVSFDETTAEQAAAKYKEWIDQGYFLPDFNGLTFDEVWQQFNDDQGAMLISGSWLSSDLQAGPNGSDFGFFLLPPLAQGGEKLTLAGASATYAIRQGSANTEVAAEYIDWMMSDRAMELWQQTGLIPVVPIDSGPAEPGLQADINAAWAQLVQEKRIGNYLDWATPTLYNTLAVSLQELGDGRISPEEFARKLQDDYAAFQAQ